MPDDQTYVNTPLQRRALNWVSPPHLLHPYNLIEHMDKLHNLCNNILHAVSHWGITGGSHSESPSEVTSIRTNKL